MENKKKPSLVYLIPDHYDFSRSGILLEEKMLYWPIMRYEDSSHNVDEINTKIIRNALEALMNLAPFSVKVSIHVNTVYKSLRLVRRTHAKIYLNEIHVVTLSHHTQVENACFFGIKEWPEIGQIKPYTNEDDINKDTQKIETLLRTWIVDDWIAFYRNRIRERIIFLNKKALNMKKEAILLNSEAKNILNSLV